MTFESVNPATGEQIASYPRLTPGEAGEAVERAQRAFLSWRRTDVSHRAALLARTAEWLRDDVERLARLMTLEMGKPIREARAEVEKCAWACDYYAASGPGALEPVEIATAAHKSFVVFRPLGVILGVMPWNFPFWQVFRFAVPALLAGNGALLKHASNVPGCALAIAEIFSRAGFPADVFQTLLIGSDQVAGVIERPEVAAVSLTGSTPAGRAVAAKAGSMLKKTVLELGGSDPYLVLDDADLEATAEVCATSRLLNNGQSCIAAKRFIVSEERRAPFEELLIASMRRYKVGDPLDESTDIGPLARADLREELHRQVQASVAAGARCLLGGEIPPGRGSFYPPTVLSAVGPGMPAYEEELFGPVAAIIAVADEEEAVRVANDSCFGLGAAVFTRDLERGERVATDELEAGSCFVNAFVRSDPRLPFGGIKRSGYGRELGSFGLHEFVNVKTVYVA